MKELWALNWSNSTKNHDGENPYHVPMIFEQTKAMIDQTF